jgi:hypothetical protein
MQRTGTMSVITLVTCPGAEFKGKENIGLLYECAPDSDLRSQFPNAIPLSELIGNFSDTKRNANSQCGKTVGTIFSAAA